MAALRRGPLRRAVQPADRQPGSRGRQPIRLQHPLRGSADRRQPTAQLGAAHAARLGPHIALAVALRRRRRHALPHRPRCSAARHGLRARPHPVLRTMTPSPAGRPGFDTRRARAPPRAPSRGPTATTHGVQIRAAAGWATPQEHPTRSTCSMTTDASSPSVRSPTCRRLSRAVWPVSSDALKTVRFPRPLTNRSNTMTTRSKPAGRLALLAFAVASLALGTAGPAFGRAPERAHVQQSFEGVIDCGAFQDTYVDEETGDLTWYLDADGKLVRFVVHVSQYSTDVSSVTGLTLHERNHHTS